MDIKLAKEVIGLYLNYKINKDVQDLGKDYYCEVCECSIGELKRAFNLLYKNYNYFKVKFKNFKMVSNPRFT